MIRFVTFCFIFSMLIVSCDSSQNQQQAESNRNNPNSDYILVNPIGDTVQTGEPLEIKSIKNQRGNGIQSVAGTPVESFTNLNIIKPGEPFVTKIDSSKIIISKSGTGSDSLPEIYEVKWNKLEMKLPVSVHAASPRFLDAAINDLRNLDVEQGLSSSYVFKVFQDSKGYMWFGTNASGVCRYDGKSLMHFSDKNGLTSNIIFEIIEDKEGNIWFGTWDGGIIKFDGNTFWHLGKNEGLKNNSVHDFFRDSKGNIWISCWQTGLAKYDGKNLTYYTDATFLKGKDIDKIFEDRDGFIWLATAHTGLIRLDEKEKTFMQFDKNCGLPFNSLSDICQDKDGSFWIASFGGGLIHFDGKTFKVYNTKNGFSDDFIYSFVNDEHGNLWIGTRSAGVLKFDGEKFTTFSEKEGLSKNMVLDLEHSGDNLWIGTNGGGVNILNEKSFQHYTATEGLSVPVVLSVLEDSKKNLWFGTYGGGLYKYDGRTFRQFNMQNGFPADIIFTIYEDKDGILWFGTFSKGMISYDGKSFTNYKTTDGLSSPHIMNIMQNRDGEFWLATNGGGVCRMNDTSIIEYSGQNQFSSIITQQCVEDNNGDIWIGTWAAGLSKYHTKESREKGKDIFTHYSKKEGLPHDIVITMMKDSTGRIWCGSHGGGLFILDPDNISGLKLYTEKDGLCSDFIRSFAMDKKGNVWIGTDKGLNLVSSELGLKENISFRSFRKEEGLKATDFLAGCVFIDHHNNAWWGTGKSLTKLNLDEFYNRSSSVKPVINIQEISLNGSSVDFRSLKDTIADTISESWVGEIQFSSVQPYQNYPTELELPYYVNHLTFHFAGLEWNAPHKLKYQYMIAELDDKWSNLTSENKADYRNIPYGKYTFRVRAIGDSGIWSDVAEYSFIINPPWWHTWWARVLFVITGFFLIAGLFRLRTAQMRKRELLLQKTVDERTAEVVLQKEIIEEKQKEILDSIYYAKRIQFSLLAHRELLKKNLGEHFIFFKPKDIVSGDFYWATKSGVPVSEQYSAAKITSENESVNKEKTGKDSLIPGTMQSLAEPFYLAVCDSTGHGVPGAFMSLLNTSYLKEAINERKISAPNLVLEHVRKRLIENVSGDQKLADDLAQSPEILVKDGMDAVLLRFDPNEKKITYAAAHNNPIIIRNNEITELEADKMPVGMGEKNDRFRLFSFNPQPGDCLYLLTDGFADQFGGPKGKKFKYSNLYSLLLKVAPLRMEEQRKILQENFERWKGELEQVDDVCIVGIRF